MIRDGHVSGPIISILEMDPDPTNRFPP
ncbi:MAG: hypothetical protein ABSH09_01770 [Bryobacteraceae bacterium]